MELKFVDPRSLKENPDKARRSKSSPQADALLLAYYEPPVEGFSGGLFAMGAARDTRVRR